MHTGTGIQTLPQVCLPVTVDVMLSFSSVIASVIAATVVVLDITVQITSDRRRIA